MIPFKLPKMDLNLTLQPCEPSASVSSVAWNIIVYWAKYEQLRWLWRPECAQPKGGLRCPWVSSCKVFDYNECQLSSVITVAISQYSEVGLHSSLASEWLGQCSSLPRSPVLPLTHVIMLQHLLPHPFHCPWPSLTYLRLLGCSPVRGFLVNRASQAGFCPRPPPRSPPGLESNCVL